MLNQKMFKPVARVLLVILGLSSFVNAQTAGSSGLNDPIFSFMGNGGYDAIDYDIALRIDPSHQVVEGATTMQAVATQDLSSFNLDFGLMTVTSVIVNGEMARFVQADPELTITPTKPILNGQALKVSLTYAGKPGSVFISNNTVYDEADFWLAQPDQLTVLSEPSTMFAWSPVNEYPSDKATFSLHLTAPKSEQAISNGILESRIENPDNTATTNYRIGTPTATYFVVLAVGEFQLEEQGKVGDVRVRHYLSPLTSDTMRFAINETPGILKFLQDKIGKYPFAEVGVLTVKNNLGFALETQSLVTFPISFGSNESLIRDAEIVAHELAHQWFGALVTFKTHRDMWVHEGFAEYFGWLYTASKVAKPESTLKEQIEKVYPNVSAGSSVLSLDKVQFITRLKGSLYGNARMSGETLEKALKYMFEGTLPITLHDEIFVKFPNGATIQQLASVIQFWNFKTVRLGVPSRVALIPLTGKPAPKVPASYGILTPPGKLKIGDDLFNLGVYYRGAMTLHALRLNLGDEKFFNLLKAYLEKYKFSNASIEDFVNLTLELDGEPVKVLLEHWLFDAQCPDFPELGLFAKDFKLGADF